MEVRELLYKWSDGKRFGPGLMMGSEGLKWQKSALSVRPIARRLKPVQPPLHLPPKVELYFPRSWVLQVPLWPGS